VAKSIESHSFGISRRKFCKNVKPHTDGKDITGHYIRITGSCEKTDNAYKIDLYVHSKNNMLLKVIRFIWSCSLFNCRVWPASIDLTAFEANSLSAAWLIGSVGSVVRRKLTFWFSGTEEVNILSPEFYI
jgi:hypothetical protein